MKKEKIRVGVSLIKQLSETFYPSINSVFGELVSNSSDAFAKTVRIILSKDEIIVEDDGIGMSPEELTKFFHISSSRKDSGMIKQSKGIRRKIIGKFGIGKLSMYRLCRRFEIISWKNSMESTAELDFDKFEKKDFIDDFYLEVDNENNSIKKTGTLIRMTGLKQDINNAFITFVKRSLSKSMPLKPDFRVIVNGFQLETTKKNGSLIEVNEKDSILGEIKGQVIIADSNISDEAGIYIRVFNRVVNESNPHIINVGILTHGLSYINRLYVDINVDSLNEAITANRSGFIEDNKKYQLFISWLRRYLNSLFSELYLAEKNILTDTEKELPEQIAFETREIFKREEVKRKLSIIEKESGKFKDKIKKRIKKDFNIAPIFKKKAKPKFSSLWEERSEELDEKFKEIELNDGTRFFIKIQKGRESDPECSLSKDGSTIIINKNHPQYKNAEKISPKTILFHCIKAIIVDISLTIANEDINLFKRTYDTLTRETIKIN